MRYRAVSDSGRPTFRWIYPPRVHVTLTTQLAIDVLRELDKVEREDPIFLAIEWDLLQLFGWRQKSPRIAILHRVGTPIGKQSLLNYPDKLSEITEVLAAENAQK
jgi:hypothetical protein